MSYKYQLWRLEFWTLEAMNNYLSWEGAIEHISFFKKEFLKRNTEVFVAWCSFLSAASPKLSLFLVCLLQISVCISSLKTHSLGRLLPMDKQEVQRQMDTIMYSVSLMSVLGLQAGRIHTLPRPNDPPLPCLLLSLGFPKVSTPPKKLESESEQHDLGIMCGETECLMETFDFHRRWKCEILFWSLVSGTRIWRRQESWNFCLLFGFTVLEC